MKPLMRVLHRLGLVRTTELEVPEAPPETIEQGSFTHGICSGCGWEGPGRRARNVAQEDADLHRLTGCGVVPVELPAPQRSAAARTEAHAPSHGAQPTVG